MITATYYVTIVEEPRKIAAAFPAGAPWEGNITPRIYVMTNGSPRNDPESGEFVVLRVRDLRFSRSAALVALYPDQIAVLTNKDPLSGTSLAERIGLTLFESRLTAFLAHPEFEWDQLGAFAGVDF
jgi:hypothetical protein